jgi:two-component system OmpR family sensor kinase
MSGQPGKVSLQARITLVTVVVAIVAVAVTGFVSLGLVRSATVDEARDQLSAQAVALAKLPDPASALDRLDAIDTTVLVIQDGAVLGDHPEYLDRALLARLAAGEPISATRAGELGLAMLAGNPARGGSAIVLVRPLASVDQALGRASGRILFALSIGLAVAMVGALLLSRVIARPLVQAARAAGRLAAGERQVPMPAASTIEVAEVTAALSALDRALEASEGRQREFLLSISHELRTPLTALRGYAEAMADGLVAETDIASVGETLVDETERLDRFVADLLELARLEADDFTIQPELVDVAALLHETARAWAGRAATLGIAIEVDGAAASTTTDPRRVRQVVDGLVENALRVTPEGGSITLRSDPGSITVLDSGPGLSDEDLAVAFERGALHSRYRNSRPVGTGLGLSISARLVERLGGTIAVANRDQGGAMFTVRLP